MKLTNILLSVLIVMLGTFWFRLESGAVLANNAKVVFDAADKTQATFDKLDRDMDAIFATKK